MCYNGKEIIEIKGSWSICPLAFWLILMRPDRKGNCLAILYILVKNETENSYHFFWANQRQVISKFFSWTQYGFSVNRCDWRILAGNEERIGRDCLNRIGILNLNLNSLYDVTWHKHKNTQTRRPFQFWHFRKTRILWEMTDSNRPCEGNVMNFWHTYSLTELDNQGFPKYDFTTGVFGRMCLIVFSCFYIEIAYSNFTFCGATRLVFLAHHNFNRTSTPPSIRPLFFPMFSLCSLASSF